MVGGRVLASFIDRERIFQYMSTPVRKEMMKTRSPWFLIRPELPPPESTRILMQKYTPRGYLENSCAVRNAST